MAAMQLTLDIPHPDDLGVMTIVLSREMSDQLPARSTVMFEGTLNGHAAHIPLEPTGDFTHWFAVDAKIAQKLRLKPSETVVLDGGPTKNWPEPIVPPNLQKVIDADPDAKRTWESTTVIARWEWVRWFESVKTDAAKRERPEKIRSMLAHGKRRPCCFNLAARNDPKNMVLL